MAAERHEGMGSTCKRFFLTCCLLASALAVVSLSTSSFFAQRERALREAYEQALSAYEMQVRDLETRLDALQRTPAGVPAGSALRFLTASYYYYYYGYYYYTEEQNVTMCLLPCPALPEIWEISGAGCTFSGPDCVQTIGYPTDYEVEVLCEIKFGDIDYVVSFEDFRVEEESDVGCYDYVTLPNGNLYCGFDTPKDFRPVVGDVVAWTTDYVVTGPGWVMCLRSSCSNYTCPGDYVLRPDAEIRHCANMTCSEEDMTTCCERGCYAPDAAALGSEYVLSAGCTVPDGSLVGAEECQISCSGDVELRGWSTFQRCDESTQELFVPQCEDNVDPFEWDIVGSCERYGPGCIGNTGVGQGPYGNNEGCNITALIDGNLTDLYRLFVTNLDTEEKHDVLMIGDFVFDGVVPVGQQQGPYDVDYITWTSDDSVAGLGWTICAQASCQTLTCPSGYYFNCAAMSSWCSNGRCQSAADIGTCCLPESEANLGAGFVPGQAADAESAGCYAPTTTVTTTRAPDFLGHLLVTPGDNVDEPELQRGLQSAFQLLGDVGAGYVRVVLGNSEMDGSMNVGWQVEQTKQDIKALTDEDLLAAFNVNKSLVKAISWRSDVLLEPMQGADGAAEYRALCEDFYPCTEDQCWREDYTLHTCNSLYETRFCPAGNPGPGFYAHYWWVDAADLPSQWQSWEWWSYDDTYSEHIKAQQVCCSCGGGSCRAGSFKLLPDSSIKFCAPCGTGSTSSPDASSCTPCQPGRFASEAGMETCEPCPSGRFNSVDAMDHCHTCDGGYVAVNEGSTQCTACEPGTYSDGGTLCRPCPPGTFNSEVGVAECQACVAGTSMNTSGATACLKCDIGRFSSGERRLTCDLCEEGTFARTQGQTTCADCPAGTYKSDGMLNCTPCEPGTFSNEEKTLACAECGPGRFANTSGSLECSPCFPGTFSPWNGRAVCELCSPGQEASDFGATQCELCQAGLYASAAAVANCSACDRGYYSPLPGATSCVICEAGRYSGTPGHSRCNECEEGSYVEYEGSARCNRCNSTLPGKAEYWTTMHPPTEEEKRAGVLQWSTLRGATNSSSCGCRPGTQPVGAACEECGEGLRCLGMGVLEIEAGYAWDRSFSVWDCSLAEEAACPGGTPGACQPGRDDQAIACSRCQDGMVPNSDGSCSECSDADYAIPSLACISCVLTAIGAYCLFDSPKRTRPKLSVLLIVTSLGQFVTIIQQIGIVSLIRVTWVSPLHDLYEFMTDIVFFDIQALRPQCVAQMDVVSLYAVRVGMVFICLGMVLVAHGASQVLQHRHDWRTRWPTLYCAMGTVILTFFVSILSTMLGPLQCKKHPNDRQTVAWYPSVTCWEGGDHASIIIIGCLACLLPMFFFVVCVWAVKVFPRRLRDGNAGFLNAWQFLFFRYTPEAYWYGPAVLARNALVAIGPVISSPIAQIMTLEIVFLFSMISLLLTMPWRVREANFLDAYGHLCLLAITMMAAFFVDKPQDALELLSVFSVLSICALPAIVLYFLGYGVLLIIRARQRPFQFFLCHHKLGAGCFCRLLKMQLQKTPGVRRKVFVDSDDLRDLDTLFDVVAHQTETIVAVSSPALLTRPWCVGELTTAHRSRIKLAPVYYAGVLPPSADFISEFMTYVPECVCLTQFGINLDMIESALEWVAESPKVLLPQEIHAESIDRLCTVLVRNHVATESLVNIEGDQASQEERRRRTRKMSEDSKVLILGDKNDVESSATAFILCGLLNPIVQHQDNSLAMVLGLGDPVPSGLKKGLLICTNTVFSTPVVDALITCADRNASVLPIMSVTNFVFPSETWMAVQPVFQELSDERREKAVHVVQAIFTEIAVDFQPSALSGTEGTLVIKAHEIAQRMFGVTGIGDKVNNLMNKKSASMHGTMSSARSVMTAAASGSKSSPASPISRRQSDPNKESTDYGVYELSEHGEFVRSPNAFELRKAVDSQAFHFFLMV